MQAGDSNVIAVDRKTGKTVFSTNRSDLRVFAGSATPTGDMVYAATERGLVFGVKPVTTGGTTGELVQAAPVPVRVAAAQP
jgi:outer membrane protein assembly factor BamB